MTQLSCVKCNGGKNAGETAGFVMTWKVLLIYETEEQYEYQVSLKVDLY